MTLAEVVRLADAERWRIRPATLIPQPILTTSGEIAGFYCPHPAGRGKYRVGPIYVRPEYRGQRLGEQAYAAMAGVPLVAYVHDGNRASMRLHERCGFERWYRHVGGWYMRRD